MNNPEVIRAESNYDDQLKVVTNREWEELHREIALIRREMSSLAHATGARRFDPEYYDLEHGEDRKRLEEAEMIDVYAELESKIYDFKRGSEDRIFDYMIEEQQKLPDNRTFVLRGHHVREILGISSRSAAIRHMQAVEKKYRGQIILQKLVAGNSKGAWVLFFATDEIGKIRGKV